MADAATNVIRIPNEPTKKLLDRQRSFTCYSNESYYRCAVTVPAGYQLEDCLKDEFWGNVIHYFKGNPAQRKQPRSGDIIEIRTEDNAWFATAYLIGVANESMKLKVLDYHVLNEKSVNDKSAFEVRWNVGHKGFDIIRKSDRVIVQTADNLPTKDMAIAWVEENTKG